MDYITYRMETRKRLIWSSLSFASLLLTSSFSQQPEEFENGVISGENPEVVGKLGTLLSPDGRIVATGDLELMKLVNPSGQESGLVFAGNLPIPVRSRADLDATISDLNGATGSITVAKSIVINSSLDIPANITVNFLPGAKLVIWQGGSLTIEGAITAGPWRIFASFGNPDLIKMVKVKSGQSVYAEWFGAIGNDYMDDRNAIQAALESSGDTLGSFNHGAVVTLLGRDYHISAPLYLYGEHNRRLVGMGPRRTRIVAMDTPSSWSNSEHQETTEEYPNGVSAMVFMGRERDIVTSPPEQQYLQNRGRYASALIGLSLDVEQVDGVSGVIAKGWLEENTTITDCLISGVSRGYGIGMASVTPSGNGDRPNHTNVLSISRCTIGVTVSNQTTASLGDWPLPLKLRGGTFSVEKCALTTNARVMEEEGDGAVEFLLPYAIRVIPSRAGSLRDLHIEHAVTGIQCERQGSAHVRNIEISSVGLKNDFTHGVSCQVVNIVRGGQGSGNTRVAICANNIAVEGPARLHEIPNPEHDPTDPGSSPTKIVPNGEPPMYTIVDGATGKSGLGTRGGDPSFRHTYTSFYSRARYRTLTSTSPDVYHEAYEVLTDDPSLKFP